MKNKVLIELIIPDIDEKFNLFIPINKRVGNVIVLLNKSVCELTNGFYVGNKNSCLYNRETGEIYKMNDLVRNTNIRHGTVLVLM